MMTGVVTWAASLKQNNFMIFVRSIVREGGGWRGEGGVRGVAS